jgi:hypothetical protein
VSSFEIPVFKKPGQKFRPDPSRAKRRLDDMSLPIKALMPSCKRRDLAAAGAPKVVLNHGIIQMTNNPFGRDAALQRPLLGRDGALRRPRPAGRNERGKRSRRLTLRSATGTAQRAVPATIVKSC